MQTPVNPFKQALQNQRRQIGFWLNLPNTTVAEIAAGAGFDWLLIDGEHAPNDLRSTLAALQAIQGHPDSHAVVRVPHDGTALIKQVLDIGAKTLLVPMVDTAEQARAVAAATQYPPRGVRGVGSAVARSSLWTARADYMEVLLTQRDALESKFELVETQKQRMNAMVNMYQELGGGWR